MGCWDVGESRGEKAAASRRHESGLTQEGPPQGLRPDLCPEDVMQETGANGLDRCQGIGVIPGKAAS